MARRSRGSGPSPRTNAKVIPFPNQTARWQSQFKAASPAERYRLLQAALETSGLEPDALGDAFATVSQILTRANRIDEQLALAKALQRQAPAVYAQMLPVQNLMLLQDAIFQRRPEAFQALITGWSAQRAESPLDVLLTATRMLLAAGHSEAGLTLADGLAAPPTEALLQEHARTLRVEACLDQVMRRQLAGQRIDWAGARKKLEAQGLSRVACETLLQRLSASEIARQIDVLDACEQRDGSFFDAALVDFGYWMLEAHGLSLMISSELLAAAQKLWDAKRPKRSLAKYIGFSELQLHRHLARSEVDPLSVILLLWGLPYVYDWLVSADFCPPAQAAKLLKLLERARAQVMEASYPGLWSFAFVYDWPAPHSAEPDRHASEGLSLRAGRTQALPLSEDPDDSPAYDQDPPDEAAFAALLAQLTAQDPRGISRLEALLDLLSPEQVSRLQDHVFALEFGGRPPAAKKPKNTAAPKASKIKPAKQPPDAKPAARPKRSALQGNCLLCAASLSKRAMLGHLESCPEVQAQLKAKSTSVTGFLLEFKAGPYWLYLLARPEASLADLDLLLRELWLECCGHLSAFTIGGRKYERSPESGTQGMKIRIDKALPDLPNFSFGYEYDYGSTTVLDGRVVKLLPTAQSARLQLLARNAELELSCTECAAPAKNVCSECLWTGEGLLCAAHSKAHACGEEMLLPVVNSPRCGVCGYTG